MTRRDADGADAGAIAALYAHYVRTSVATFEEDPPGADLIRARLHAVQRLGLPWRVALDAEGTLVGYACAAPYRARSAYRYTLENSVYVSHHHLGTGIGSALMREVIDRCAALGYRQMLAVIGDSGNAGSIRLHASLGFAMIGTHPAVGYKFGRWIDVVHMQLVLGDGAQSAPIPR
jgi:L-amino acid N-acyltransferase YncA